MKQRTRGVFDALVEDHGGFVFVVPVDVDPGLGLGFLTRSGRRVFVLDRPRRGGTRRVGAQGRRDWRWGRRDPGSLGGRRRPAKRGRAGWRGRSREPAAARGGKLGRRRSGDAATRRRSGRAARHGRRRRATARATTRRDGRSQPEQRFLARGRRRRCRGSARGRRSTRARFFRCEPVENVQIRTGLVAHRFRSLDSGISAAGNACSRPRTDDSPFGWLGRRAIRPRNRGITAICSGIRRRTIPSLATSWREILNK